MNESLNELPSLSILLAEDSTVHQLLAASLLNARGHQITVAADGQAVLDALGRGGNFDVILMDVDMPRMDGMTATRHIRELNDPSLCSIPIVAVTANENPEECLAAGMDAYLTKPLQPKLLEQILRRLLVRSAV
jgi:CheY-like chemotaxis protein